jgi:PAS domain S-box-containing protein
VSNISQQPSPIAEADRAFPAGEGEMADAIAAHDWSTTPLGPIAGWPQSLRSAVQICLSSGFPSFVWWGAELTQLYNDAAIPILRGKHPAALGAPAACSWADVWATIGEVAAAVLATGATALGENKQLLTDRAGPRELAWFSFSYSALRDELGAIAGVFVIAIETTASITSERRLTAERERLVRMYEQAPGLIAVLDGPDHIYTVSNAAHRALLGFDPVGQRAADAHPELVEQGIVAMLDQVFETGEPFRAEAMQMRLARGSGGGFQDVFADFVLQPITDEQGQVTGIFVEGADVTARVETEARLRIITNAVPAFIWIAEPDGRITYLNERWTEYTGQSMDAARDFGWTDMVHPDDRDPTRAVWLQAVESGTVYEVECRYRRHDGAYRWYVARAEPMRDAAGHVTAWFGSSTDIDDQKLTAAALLASEERLRDVTDAMPVLISYFDAEHRFRFANKAYESWFGRSVAEIVGRPVAEVMGEAMYAVRRPWMERALAGEPVSYEGMFTVGGAMRHTVIQHIPHFAPDGRVLGAYALVQDVTEQKRIEDELRDSRDRLQAVLDATPAAIMIATTPDCTEIVGNRRATELMRMPGGHNMSKSSDDAPVAHFRVLTPEGRPLSPEELPVQRAARGEELFMYEEKVAFADGDTVHLLGNAVPLRDERGGVRGAVGAFIDISERKRAEERQKLLIDELNHRVKNTLAVVQGIAQQTFKDSAVPPGLRDAFEGRLAALSGAHELLTMQRWQAAGMRAVVEGGLASLGVHSERVRISGDDLMLPPKTAVSFAMAVHELATNAVKYGALSVPEGIVSIDWSQAEGRLHFAWRERNGPVVAQPTRRGFGTRMIERALAAELSGTVRIDFAPQGVTCVVDAPAV